MSVIKGILLYTAIVIGLILAVGVILLGIMYFFPQVSVFGYKLYHGKGEGYIYEVVANDSVTTGLDNVLERDKEILDNLDAVVIDTDNWNVNVILYDATGIDNNISYFRASMSREIFGFITTDSKAPTFSVTAEKKALTGQEEVKNVVTFKTNEPKGTYYSKNAKFNIWIPNTLHGGHFEDFIIYNGSGKVNFIQKTVIDPNAPVGNPEITVDNLTLVDGSNDVNINHININNNFNIQSNSSNLSVEKNLSCNINIDCKKGKYHFMNIESDSNSAVVNVNAVNADVKFNDVEGNLTLKSDYGFFRANTIYGQFSSLSHNKDDYNNACDLKIQKVLGTTEIQNDSGNIEIGQVGTINSTTVGNDLRIDTHSGDVKITNCFAKNVVVTSTSGIIRLGNALGSMDIKTDNGSVYLNYLTHSSSIEGEDASNIANAVDKLKDKTIKISTGTNSGNGAIEVLNARSQLQLISNGRGKVYAVIDELPNASQNIVESKNGNVEIIVPDESKFWLDWKATSSANIKIADFSTQEKVPNANMNNYDEDLAVGVGGVQMDTTTSLNAIANKNLVILSKLHTEIR